MDKSWMDEARTSKKFEVGLDKFLKFAKSNASDKNKIYCPCSKCSNTAMFSIGVIKDHIYFNGIDRSYKNWKWHGEPSRSYISSHKLGNTETCGESSVNRKIDEGEHEVDMGIPEDEVEQEVSDGKEFVDAGFEFMKLVDDADKPIYPGCVRNTKLNVLIRSFNLKAKHGMSDSCYSDWLMFLNELLPEGNEIPGTFYAAKKTLCALGLDYEKYHCCHNDCIVYRKQHSDALSCPTCGESRWKLDKDDNERVGVPAKVMWFLPPIPRFRRMFSSPTTAEDLTWHEHGRKKDGVMRHPADSPTWSLADTRYPVFGAEPRNLRLGLSTDGFNPHSEKKSKYSCWPVILVTYNLPPSLCMKRKYMSTEAHVAPKRKKARIEKDKVLAEKDTKPAEKDTSSASGFADPNTSKVRRRQSKRVVEGRRRQKLEDDKKIAQEQEAAISEGEGEVHEVRTLGKKLLKRGCVTMCHIPKRVTRGIKMRVAKNKHGQPVGKWGKEMQSYIGVLVRTKISIGHIDWRYVNSDAKEKIWESITDAYLVPEDWKDLVLASADVKWKEWKSNLWLKYVKPFLDSPEEYAYPPRDYTCITQADWDLFIDDRLSLETKELSQMQSDKRAKVKCLHRTARKGYANLEQDLLKSGEYPDGAVDRATLWKHARLDKLGNFVDPEAEECARKIDELKRKVSEGEITVEGTDDVLTKALGSEEPHGRVRGVGGFVKQRNYFENLKRGSRKRRSSAAQTFRKILAEVEAKHAQERADWEKERQRVAGVLSRIEEKLNGEQGKFESPKNHGPPSGQSSCTRACDKAKGMVGNDVKGDLAKKKLILMDVNKDAEKEKEHLDNEIDVPEEENLKEVPEKDHQFRIPSSNEVHSSNENEVKLAIGSLSNVVAIGTIVEAVPQSSAQLIHGVPMEDHCLRVSVIRAIIEDAKLPYPVKDEIVAVRDAIGTHVAWPEDMIIQNEKAKKKPKRRLVKQQRMLNYEDEDKEDLVNLPNNLPPSLKKLCQWANTKLTNGKTISIETKEEVFGHTQKTWVERSQVHAMVHLGELKAASITLYMSYLHEELMKSAAKDIYVLVDPARTGTASGNPTQRSNWLFERLSQGTDGKLFIVPYNTGGHWVLTVVNPMEEVVYCLDPLTRRLISGEWKTIVDSSLRIYNAQANKRGRKTPMWIPLSGIPEQKGATTCGFWIMRYMKEIVQDSQMEWITKWARRGQLQYTTKDIDVVRAEWAKQAMVYLD